MSSDAFDEKTVAMKMLAEVRLVESARPGAFRVSVFRHRAFISGILFLMGNGITMLIWNYAAAKGLVSLRSKEFAGISLFSWFFVGSLVVTGQANLKRVGIIIAGSATACTWAFIFFNENGLKTLSFIPQIFPFLYFILTDPGVISQIGIRKEKLLKDIATAIFIAALMTAYMFLIAFSFRYTLNLIFGTIAAWFLEDFMYGFVIFTLLFSVWNRTKADGANRLEQLLVIVYMVMVMNLLPLMGLFLGGGINFQGFILGYVGSILIFTISCSLGFRFAESVLVPGFAYTTIMVFMKMAALY